MEPEQCQAYTTKRRSMARGAQQYVRCVQPATQTRTFMEPALRGSYERMVHLCPRHVGMFDKGQHGILDSRA
jgi:hypothetical protein